eukprot:TRINITY_DN1524_c0_g1_i4.p1 TRINITY_DN1524_c0_g1~~TRINITY_DN1524_c0_g1_i4.p1  ORF type:complete len:469 (-),score=84.11 TRINITY_DN1524_c0_g1_i4:101-1507(-)
MGQTIKKPEPHEVEQLTKDFDANCEKAAKLISESDIFLLSTGAGFSSDSGLKVYKDIADVPAYNKRNLKYHDLCQPQWVNDDPETFFGFWGACFNDYRNTEPHEGYQIVKKWKENMFYHKKNTDDDTDHIWNQIYSTHARDVIREVNNLTPEEKCTTLFRPEHLNHLPGPFYILTSNVDAHSQKAGFHMTEIMEIHGNTETWQCSDSCTQKIWKAPDPYYFNVNTDTMLCKSEESGDLEVRHINHGFGPTDENHVAQYHPMCINCGSAARPSILMFSDISWIEDDKSHSFYSAWQKAVQQYLDDDQSRKIVILEIGCGNRVPTIRNQSSSYMKVFDGQSTLIRVNKDFPFGDGDGSHPNVIPILSGGLEAIKKIDYYLSQLNYKNNNHNKIDVDASSKVKVNELPRNIPNLVELQTKQSEKRNLDWIDIFRKHQNLQKQRFFIPIMTRRNRKRFWVKNARTRQTEGGR